MTAIRLEKPEDLDAIRSVLENAFGRPEEADLVDALRRRSAVTLSLVAEQDGEVVGHIMFSPVTIGSGPSTFQALGLGPLAVSPSHQNRGIGSRLVRDGIERCREAGYGIVVVLGRPSYYPRFGFAPAMAHGIAWELDAPDDAFMVMELRKGALAERSGVVRYQPEFTGV